ncbi:YtxH domain-containing protein [Spirosoma sordidisoli]|uniref:YtxH domain-containing protein n=1 Tax=Spirosoma sordidisoli TaxID=2502893 RepID=A0A4V1RVU6_9BACT|nr:YtxH domain-containing protein [Spirosoma sordidisoli]RYC67998.1 YtxH domain-containing protein [Spirosoma sordidisoli]
MLFERRKHPQDYLTDQTFLTGVLTGLVTGLTIGFLFAPRSGKKLRKQIANSLSDQSWDAQRQWNRTKEQARETVDTIKANVGYVADKAKNKAEHLADDVRSGVDHLKDAARIG